ncbi:hypothetical protein BKH42_01920 [Helicobacter sp. 13S00482-2]|uniref:hypothetical protein n=1 Tax=Helicobacter sp. 13S00482-2 TaxID=1476200 RepID=UPI000BA5B63C|nr:hypothetical protein [Helicobacter sp. 13S00482-2]PAF54282.1 hypothetical protein BKH42_01920 [Helicobacter sp. 13S00482-2]
MKSDFMEICKANGIFTRIIACGFELFYDKASDIYEKEYMKIADMNADDFENWIERLKSKNKFDRDNEVMLEVLTQIYYKLISIENFINKREANLHILGKKSSVCALGHGIICIDSAELEVGADYYMRFELPIFPKRIIASFGQAISEQVIKITKMHQKDTEDFDMYIANKEMENLRLKHNTKDK